MKQQRKLVFLLLLTFVLYSCNTKERRIELAVLMQLKQYPESTLQDVYKNFYQDRFGPGHAISNPEAVKHYLDEELLMMESPVSPMVEVLGWEHRFVRISLEMVKEGMISEEELHTLFLESAIAINPEDAGQWQKEWVKITEVIEKRKLSVNHFSEDKKMIDSLLQINPTVALHHSAVYRQHYHPHYRVVSKELYESRFGDKFLYLLE